MLRLRGLRRMVMMITLRVRRRMGGLKVLRLPPPVEYNDADEEEDNDKDENRDRPKMS